MMETTIWPRGWRDVGRSLLVGALILAVLTWCHCALAGDPRPPRPTALARVDSVMAIAVRSAADSVNPDSLAAALTATIVRTLHDPYAVVWTPAQHADFARIQGEAFGGVGVELVIQGPRVTVHATTPAGPAARAGVHGGDLLVAVDGDTTMPADTITERLRGPIGSTVRLRVRRPGVDTVLTLIAHRDTVRSPSVTAAAAIGGHAGYIHLERFGEGAATEVADAATRLVRAGATRLVLDLRGNPGGLLDEGIATAALFLPRGSIIVETRGRTSTRVRAERASGAARFPTIPLAVLVDDGTASAAEVVAGALQDHDRALIVGTRTYGKGVAQTIYDLPGGFAFKLTTARWFTPSGRSIQRTHPSDADHPVGAVFAHRETTRRFRSDRGRVLATDGGITPDLIVHDRIDAMSDSLRQALGAHRPRWVADSLYACAIRLANLGGTPSGDRPVYPRQVATCLDEITPLLPEAAVAALAHATPWVAREMGLEMRTATQGTAAALAWLARSDDVVQAALAHLAAFTAPTAPARTPTRADTPAGPLP